MNKKRKLIIILATVVFTVMLVVGLTSCGSDDNDPTEAPSGEFSEYNFFETVVTQEAVVVTESGGQAATTPDGDVETTIITVTETVVHTEAPTSTQNNTPSDTPTSQSGNQTPATTPTQAPQNPVTPTNAPTVPSTPTTGAPVHDPTIAPTAPQIDYTLDPVTPTVTADKVGKKQYTTYSVTCTIDDGEGMQQSMQLATDGTRSMLRTKLEDQDIGFIISSKSSDPLIIIDHIKQKYLALSAALMKIAGVSTEELLDQNTLGQLGLFEITNFAGAKPQLVKESGYDCYKYGYIDDDGYIYYYMRSGINVPFIIERTAADGTVWSRILFTQYSPTVGNLLEPPAGYGVVEFSLSNMDEAMEFIDGMNF